MSEWQTELVYTDEKSNKFWRARTEGSEFIVNYGRVGTDGQTKIKDMGSAADAIAELEKVAAQKRKKGYGDGGVPAAAAKTPTVANKKGKFVAKRAGKTVEVEVKTDGASIKTEIEETLESPSAAAAAFDKIAETLIAAGYKKA